MYGQARNQLAAHFFRDGLKSIGGRQASGEDPAAHGKEPGEMKQDVEGKQIVEVPGKNMVLDDEGDRNREHNRFATGHGW